MLGRHLAALALRYAALSCYRCLHTSLTLHRSRKSTANSRDRLQHSLKSMAAQADGDNSSCRTRMTSAYTRQCVS